MDNYMKNYDFYLLMTDYLSEGRALREIYTSSDYMLQFRVTRFLEDCENRGFNEAMTEIIRQLESRGYLSEKRHEQFCIAKEAADRRAGTDAEAVFKLLYTTYNKFRWSDMAGNILFDHYGEIIREIMEKHKAPADVAQFVTEALPGALSDCVMDHLDSCEMIAYRGEEELWVYRGGKAAVTGEQTDENDEDSYLEESRPLHCYIVSIGDKPLECYLGSNGGCEIPACLIEDGDVRLADFVTLVDEADRRAVTCRITGETEAQNGVAEPVYQAVSLPYAILREEDIEAYLA